MVESLQSTYWEVCHSLPFSCCLNEALYQGLGGADWSSLTLLDCPIARTPQHVSREMFPSGSDSFTLN